MARLRWLFNGLTRSALPVGVGEGRRLLDKGQRAAAAHTYTDTASQNTARHTPSGRRSERAWCEVRSQTRVGDGDGDGVDSIDQREERKKSESVSDYLLLEWREGERERGTRNF